MQCTITFKATFMNPKTRKPTHITTIRKTNRIKFNQRINKCESLHLSFNYLLYFCLVNTRFIGYWTIFNSISFDYLIFNICISFWS
jgi:hypothetical protein